MWGGEENKGHVLAGRSWLRDLKGEWGRRARGLMYLLTWRTYTLSALSVTLLCYIPDESSHRLIQCCLSM